MVWPNSCYSIKDMLDFNEYYTKYSPALKYISFVLSMVTCIIGLVGNTTVICFTGFLMKGHKSKIWFLNLAIADFLSVLLLPFHAISILKGNWPFGQHMCKFFLFSVCANMYASIFILIALNITRVLSVAQPMFHLKFISQRISCWTCTLIWIITVLSTLPVLFLSSEFKVGKDIQCILLGLRNHSGHFVTGYNMSKQNNVTDRALSGMYKMSHYYFRHCSGDKCCSDEETVTLWNQMIFSTQCFVIPLILIGYFLPLCVIIFSNITIAVQVRNSQAANTHRLYRIIVTIIMLYFITWTPLVMAEIVLLAAGREMNLIVIFKVITFMPLFVNVAYVNCCLNPIMYVLVSRRIRTGLAGFLSSFRNSCKLNS